MTDTAASGAGSGGRLAMGARGTEVEVVATQKSWRALTRLGKGSHRFECFTAEKYRGQFNFNLNLIFSTILAVMTVVLI